MAFVWASIREVPEGERTKPGALLEGSTRVTEKLWYENVEYSLAEAYANGGRTSSAASLVAILKPTELHRSWDIDALRSRIVDASVAKNDWDSAVSVASHAPLQPVGVAPGFALWDSAIRLGKFKELKDYLHGIPQEKSRTIWEWLIVRGVTSRYHLDSPELTSSQLLAGAEALPGATVFRAMLLEKEAESLSLAELDSRISSLRAEPVYDESRISFGNFAYKKSKLYVDQLLKNLRTKKLLRQSGFQLTLKELEQSLNCSEVEAVAEVFLADLTKASVRAVIPEALQVLNRHLHDPVAGRLDAVDGLLRTIEGQIQSSYSEIATENTAKTRLIAEVQHMIGKRKDFVMGKAK